MIQPNLGYLRVDTQGIIREWDAVMTQHFGYTQQDAIGQEMILFIPEKYHSRHWAGFRAAMKRTENLERHYRHNAPFRHKDNTHHLHPISEILLRDPQGNPNGVLAIVDNAITPDQDNGLKSIYLDALDD